MQKLYWILRVLMAMTCLGTGGLTAQVYRGMSKAEVIRAVGEPTSTLSLGEKDVLIYNQGRIELRNDQLIKAQGFTIELKPSPEETIVPLKGSELESPPPEVQQTSAIPVETPAVDGVATEPTPVLPIAAQTPAPPAMGLNSHVGVEKALENYEAPNEGPTLSWKVEIPFMIFRMLFVMIALYPAYKFFDVDAGWTAYPLVAFVDAASREIIFLVAIFVFKIDHLYYVDESIATLVTTYTVHKITRCSGSDAFQVAIATNIASIIVMLLAVSMLGSFMMKL